ncbi:MAG: DUF4446 family protein [Clostridia bacterium]|nr:DUF4446 family protein [Clostridia bacterium]
MEIINSIIKSDVFLMGIAVANLLLLILYVCNLLSLKKINRNYKKFMKKIGNGNNIEETLERYISRVEEATSENKEILQYCQRLDKEISLCVKKIGMVRYNAFKDTGSDLSFALAMLNDKNDGVLLNGIYSREMSNIYAKQVKEGKTSSQISEEEKQALEIALEQ